MVAQMPEGSVPFLFSLFQFASVNGIEKQMFSIEKNLFFCHRSAKSPCSV